MTHEVEHWTQELGLKLEETPYGRLSHWDLPGEVIRSEVPLPTHDSWKEISYYQGTQSPETFEQLKLHSDEFLKRQGFERVGGKYRILKHTEDRVVRILPWRLRADLACPSAGAATGPGLVRFLDAA